MRIGYPLKQSVSALYFGPVEIICYLSINFASVAHQFLTIGKPILMTALAQG
jgi:hypothetical protein